MSLSTLDDANELQSNSKIMNYKIIRNFYMLQKGLKESTIVNERVGISICIPLLIVVDSIKIIDAN